MTLATTCGRQEVETDIFLLIANYITEEFEMHSRHLQYHHLPGVHDHIHISEVITDALAEWCIQLDTDFVAFVRDNGSNIKKSLKDNLVIKLSEYNIIHTYHCIYY